MSFLCILYTVLRKHDEMGLYFWGKMSNLICTFTHNKLSFNLLLPALNSVPRIMTLLYVYMRKPTIFKIKVCPSGLCGVSLFAPFHLIIYYTHSSFVSLCSQSIFQFCLKIANAESWFNNGPLLATNQPFSIMHFLYAG